MKISLLNEKILFQKSAVMSDAIGNRKMPGKIIIPVLPPLAGKAGNKKSEAGQTVDGVSITFTVRYCSRLVDIVSTGFRILFRGEIYNILSIAHMNYKKKSLKFRCEKARR